MTFVHTRVAGVYIAYCGCKYAVTVTDIAATSCNTVSFVMQSLRKITQVLLASAASFLAIFSLIMLFLVVFAIIGLHVYGGTQKDEYPNFNTFLLSITTMFQASTALILAYELAATF